MLNAQRITIVSLFLSLFFYSSFTEAQNMSTLKISSPAFKHNDHIPPKYTCDGIDVNPPLTIENVPSGAKSLALIVDDPDAPRGTWVHWVVWNIATNIQAIAEHTVPSGASEGMNDFRKRNYGGPCPPSGTHRYFFKLYALDSLLTLNTNATKVDLERAMKGHILAQSEVIGLYTRK
jgi:Raf kinase inhibitor-like YbhB/YbcL family protein